AGSGEKRGAGIRPTGRGWSRGNSANRASRGTPRNFYSAARPRNASRSKTNSKTNIGSELIISAPRRWAFCSLARREERCDLDDHERRATTPACKRAASLRVAAKIAAGFVKRFDRIADTLFAFLLPGERFWPQRGSRK